MKPTCNVSPCDRPVLAKGMCGKHYQRQAKHGDPRVVLVDYEQPKVCSVSGCGEPLSCKGLCGFHYRRKNAERLRAYTADYRTWPGVAEKSRVYRIANRGHRTAYQREWRRKNPEHERLLRNEAAYRRRCRLAGVSFELFSRDAIYVRDKGLCAYCGLGLDPLNWHLDHVVPIVAGGGHVRSNVVASCPTCNLTKSSRPASVMRSERSA
jgi:5-methylcytosine-specific restriction endonuclease McrA